MTDSDTTDLLRRAVHALERLAPRGQDGDSAASLDQAEAFVWEADAANLLPVESVNRVDLVLLKGIERQAQTLLTNTRQFAAGHAANNALLWGARGMGKSSLVKAVHAKINAEREYQLLRLIEIHRGDVIHLPRLLRQLRASRERCLLFCDDLSFEQDETGYKSLKAVLEGGLEGRPPNVLFYATSNRRHLMPRRMVENERQEGIHPGEGVEEKVSLSDRFGLWLGFHPCDQDTFLAMVDGYAADFALKVAKDDLHRQALEWATTRGGRSGRIAWQFIQDLAGQLATTQR